MIVAARTRPSFPKFLKKSIGFDEPSLGTTPLRFRQPHLPETAAVSHSPPPFSTDWGFAGLETSDGTLLPVPLPEATADQVDGTFRSRVNIKANTYSV
jgi:hypothetical protein